MIPPYTGFAETKQKTKRKPRAQKLTPEPKQESIPKKQLKALPQPKEQKIFSLFSAEKVEKIGNDLLAKDLR